MKLNELKCKNCGSMLEVPADAEQVKCEFCGSVFSVDDDYIKGYKYTKGVLKAHKEQAEEVMNLYKNSKESKVFKLAVIIASIIIIFGFCSIVFGMHTFDIDKFNSSYEMNTGKTSGFFMTGTLDDVVTNNKTNKKHKIVVEYKDISSSKEDDIKQIRDSLSSSRYYDVSLDYDNSGYVNKITIKDLEN